MTRLLSKKHVAQMVCFHPGHVMRLAREGKFPKPIKTGATENCAVRFLEEEIEAWIEARKHARSD